MKNHLHVVNCINTSHHGCFTEQFTNVFSNLKKLFVRKIFTVGKYAWTNTNTLNKIENLEFQVKK